MGFETRLGLFLNQIVLHLNFVPMGFETKSIEEFAELNKDLNFVPMGFETIVTLSLHCDALI